MTTLLEEPTESDGSVLSDDVPVIDELAAARLITSLERKRPGVLSLESTSVYGAVVLMPQLARSAGWPRSLTSTAFKSFVYGALNVAFQFWLLSVVEKEEMVYNPFGGEMYLCDFGEGRRGPLGTRIDSASRLYASFSQWNTRVFVRDSLLATFPDKAEQIRDSVDPGEYGVESNKCRYCCCLVFVMSTLPELLLIVLLARLLYHVPTRAQSWVKFDVKDREQRPDSWLDFPTVKIAGMPASWKLINVLFVLVPKAILWKMTVQAGIDFLMDTAAIDELIVNAVAMTFILQIDEMLFEVFFSEETKAVLRTCEGYPMYPEEEEPADEQLLRSFRRMQRRGWGLRDLHMLVPWRLMLALFVFLLFMGRYYYAHCTWSDEDGFVSQSMYLPVSSDFTVLNAVLPNFFHLVRESVPFWTWQPQP